MKSITKINILALLVASFCVSVLSVTFLGQPTYAYTCKWSNNGGNQYTSEMGYSGQLFDKGGTCVIEKPDTAAGGVPMNSGGDCPRDKSIEWEGQCYGSRIEYTNIKPTNDDGSAVADQDWAALCEGSDFDQYNAERHRCENDGILSDIGMCSSVAWDTDSIDGDCEAPGNGEAKPLEEVKPDTTGAKVEECISLNGNNVNAWDGVNKQCNWTKEGCPGKNGGQGRWVDATGKCEAYTDYTNQQLCETNGGQWMQNPKDSTHMQCQKPGTPFQDGEETPEAKPPSGQIPTVSGKCGKARVNILECEAQASDPSGVLTGVLRIAIIVLTMAVGAAALGGLVWAALQYARASDDQSTLSDAKTRIRNIVIGLFLYGFIIAITNFLVPGGVLGGP